MNKLTSQPVRKSSQPMSIVMTSAAAVASHMGCRAHHVRHGRPRARWPLLQNGWIQRGDGVRLHGVSPTAFGVTGERPCLQKQSNSVPCKLGVPARRSSTNNDEPNGTCSQRQSFASRRPVSASIQFSHEGGICTSNVTGPVFFESLMELQRRQTKTGRKSQAFQSYVLSRLRS